MSFIFPPAERPALPIAGTSALFPARRVYCVGRNYAAHGIEMGGDPTREPPFFFMKPADALQPVPGDRLAEHPYPPQTLNYHFEIEMVVALKHGGRDIPVEKALDCVFGYAVGIDMTRRDLQDEAKQMRRPWELAKGGDYSGPLGPLHPVSQVGHVDAGEIVLEVDGQVRQTGDLKDMIWSVAEQISYLSTFFEVMPGDVIFSGTPAGVGAVERGQTMTARIAKLGEIKLMVV
jgi:fumarylpyruvate hydrolase